MKYRKFIIRNYRAIVGPLEIDVRKFSLMPIIGTNESGKTTILQAIFSFDSHNDELNDNGRHLKDVANLYGTSSASAQIEAEIEIDKRELLKAIQSCIEKHTDYKVPLTALLGKRNLPSVINVTRDLQSRMYSIIPSVFGPIHVQNVLAEQIVSRLPYILYFDDFRDKVAERVEIPSDRKQNWSEWALIIEELFKQTDKTFSIRNLAAMEERQRKTILSKVERKLNATLTKEWQTFNLDDRDALKISIEFQQDVGNESGQTPSTTLLTQQQKSFLKLDVVEKDSLGDEHFFFISDRSKGFYWFFNFVMKLEFNSKLVFDASPLYLLDEPGSYLHAFAQRKLCMKLRQLSAKSWVAYCTHSHYLLDPEVIPVNSIKVAEKDGSGAISLVPLTLYKVPLRASRSAFQPVFDALQMSPFMLDISSVRVMVLTEGIYDYFALELFRGDRDVSFLPSVGADSVKYYISVMVGWRVDFRALWDNDHEGRTKHKEAIHKFGEEMAAKHFMLLPFGDENGKWIMQNLFEGVDLVMIRGELGLSQSCSYEGTLQALFYSSNRQDVFKKISDKTKQNFEVLFKHLSL